MRYVRVQDGFVVEVGEFESVEGRFHPSLLWVQSDVAEVGDAWDGAAFTKPPVTDPEVPSSVTRRQALQQLRIDGFTEEQIIEKINALPIDQLHKDLALIEFKESQIFERNRQLVTQLGAMLGKDAVGVDAMFIAAAKL